MKDEWRPIETAPRDGTWIIASDGDAIRVCYPKAFPRPLAESGDDQNFLTSRAGDVWEYFRDDEHAPGHSWSMCPTHWMPLPPPPAIKDQPND
jgi:hypothetical protein